MVAENLNWISLGRYRFTMRFREKAQLPPFMGKTLRGGMGHLLRQVSCSTDQDSCGGCLVNRVCPYAYIFETRRPPGATLMTQYKQVPRPYVLEPPCTDVTDFDVGDKLQFSLVLVGRAISYLPYLVLAFQELGGAGLGQRRAQFELEEICSELPDGGATVIYGGEQVQLEQTQFFTPEHIPDGRSGPSITLNFRTPVRLRRQGKVVNTLDFRTLMSTLLRRLSALSYFHCGRELKLDFKGLVERADTVEVTSDNMRWTDQARFSGRQQRRIRMGGLTGSIRFRGPIDEFRPLLALGQVVHVGRGTALGLGNYEVVDTASGKTRE